MKTPITVRYAVRSLLRHKRRTLLSVVGIGVGCAVSLFLISFVRGAGEMMMRAAAENGNGHLRVVPSDWIATRNRDLRLANWRELLEKIRGFEYVETAVPHSRVEALLAMGTRTTGVTISGVDPDGEPAINRLVRSVTEGAYLSADSSGEAVIGKAVADRLNVGIDDDLMVTASGKGGEMRGAMLRVRGLISTGSRDLDSSLCHVPLSQAAEISGYDGAAEISILLSDHERVEEAKSRIALLLAEGQDVVLWSDIVPELAAGVEVDETWTNLSVGVVLVVVFLGIASAQLAAVLERRREFAVLSALGMKGWRLVTVMLAESFALGLAGTLVALGLGVPAVYWISVNGIDFSNLYRDMDLAVSDVLVDPVIYGDFGFWLVPLAAGLSFVATLLSSLYPAFYARSVDPAEALRVEG